jgi:hypothetical protein
MMLYNQLPSFIEENRLRLVNKHFKRERIPGRPCLPLRAVARHPALCLSNLP